jgi:hypothetical protein
VWHVFTRYLSADAAYSVYLRHEALKTVRAILGNVHGTMMPQTHESFVKELDFLRQL